MRVSQTIQALLRQLHQADKPTNDAADADLLERFARSGDAAAFTALVACHGPMVLGVCGRMLGDPHDAEDAFQATFMVLARKAGMLGRGDSVGAWLHGVAYRVAAHARTDRARRRTHERRATAMPVADTTPAILWEDLRPVLDAEVGRLPEKYRVPVVLCYLGGKTYDEAARELGCPKGTIATRLVKARELLRDRLIARGATLPAAGLLAVLADSAQASIPPALLQATVEAATISTAPTAVAVLTEEVLKAMAVPRLKSITVLLAAGLLLAAGAAAFAYRPAGDDNAAIASAKAVSNEEPPWGDLSGGIQVRIRNRQTRWTAEEPVSLDIDLRNRAAESRQVFPPVGLWPLWEVEVDGVWSGRKQTLPPGAVEETPPKHLLDISQPTSLKAGEEVKAWHVLRLDGAWQKRIRGEVRLTSVEPERLLALAPGRHTIRVAYHYGAEFRPVSNPVEVEVVASFAEGKGDQGWIRVRTWAEDKSLLFRPDGTGRIEAKADQPEGRILSPDRKSILYVTWDNDQTAVHVADADGKNTRQLSADGVVSAFPVWSPNGKRVAFLAGFAGKMQVHLVDRDGKNLRKLTDAPHGAGLPKFGPNGRLAYFLLDGKRQPSALMVIDDRGAKTETLVRDVLITGYAWSPDGTSIAYGKPGALVFHDLRGGKSQEVALTEVEKRLTGYGAFEISWSPDGRGVACLLTLLGPRAGVGPGVPRPFGDDEVFVIPRAGKPTWFTTGRWVRDVEWLRDNPVQPDPAPKPAGNETPTAIGEWSETVDGIRGRLVIVPGGPNLPTPQSWVTLVYVELEKTTNSGPRAVYFDPESLQCKLTSADGKAAPQSPFGGSGGRGGPPASWVTLPYDSLMRLRANPSGYSSPDGLHIALTNNHYLLKTGDPMEYHLSGTLNAAPPADHGRTNAWVGVLKLPPVKLRAPAPARPAITDAASGITVTVQDDGCTITARDKDGKVVWDCDVIKTANIPIRGAASVRDLQLKNGKLTAVFGKHSFADFDLATGKFLGAGSD